jgi:hypothetical protein
MCWKVVKSEEKKQKHIMNSLKRKTLPGFSLPTYKGNVLDKMDQCHQLNRNYDYWFNEHLIEGNQILSQIFCTQNYNLREMDKFSNTDAVKLHWADKLRRNRKHNLYVYRYIKLVKLKKNSIHGDSKWLKLLHRKTMEWVIFHRLP